MPGLGTLMYKDDCVLVIMSQQSGGSGATVDQRSPSTSRWHSTMQKDSNQGGAPLAP